MIHVQFKCNNFDFVDKWMNLELYNHTLVDIQLNRIGRFADHLSFTEKALRWTLNQMLKSIINNNE